MESDKTERKKPKKRRMKPTDDSRFESVFNDPKFRRMPTREKKIVIDDRFADMLTEPNFQLVSKVDKRGRPVQHSTSDELKRFYQLPSGEEAEKKRNDAESDVEETPIRLDLARGEGNVSSSDDESSDDWSVDDEADDQLNVDWGELDKEALRVESATARLAVCNQDWDKIKAKDLLVLLSSFAPPGGSIKRVAVYPSQFGTDRMKEEEVNGPLELKEGGLSSESESDTVEDQRKKKSSSNRLRQYQLNRLKYFFAVAECDCAATADVIYSQCDGVEYETSGARIDLRFIPDDTSFDEITPRDKAEELSDAINYRPKLFTTAALQLSSVELTWDETDPDRVQMAKRAFDPEQVKNLDLKDYIGGSSGSEESEDEGKQQKSAKYRQLLEEIKSDDPWAKPKVKSDDTKADSSGAEEEESGMEITWEPGLTEKTKEIVEKVEKKKRLETNSDLTPFQQYLQRKKEKKKERREKKRRERESDTSEGDSFSDDAVPDGFASEDFGIEFRKPKEKTLKSSAVATENQGELDLLLAAENPDESDRRHFNMNKIEKADRAERKKKKKKSTAAVPSASQNFDVDVKDSRFEAIFSSHHYNIDPSEPQFKRTKGMEKLMGEKHRRLGKGQVAKPPSVESSEETQSHPDVQRLVKAVKQKTSNWQSRKKQKVQL